MKHYQRVLTIAGSDPSGGAGIQADIKTISSCGAYAMSAITAITVQNTLGVQSVFPLPEQVVVDQIDAVLSDIGVDAVKIGMLHSASLMREVAAVLEKHKVSRIVLDPVMVSTSGHKLIQDDAIKTLQEVLIPMATVITPNVPEAEVLLGQRIEGEEAFKDAAYALSLGGKVSVYMKAGHVEERVLKDIFFNAERGSHLPLLEKRIETCNTHGTGCTLSSAFASYLAKGMELQLAAIYAKDYVNNAIIAGSAYEIGHGHGPVCHFFEEDWTVKTQNYTELKGTVVRSTH